jgi:hypothetical protein
MEPRKDMSYCLVRTCENQIGGSCCSMVATNVNNNVLEVGFYSTGIVVV